MTVRSYIKRYVNLFELIGLQLALNRMDYLKYILKYLYIYNNIIETKMYQILNNIWL